MMMKIAGGPGSVGPIDFNERKRPMPRWMLAAIAVSALAHGGVGVWLYQQNVALPEIEPTPGRPPTIVTLDRPPPKPTVSTAAPAPTPPIHRPLTTTATDEPLVTDLPDTPAQGQPDTLTTINTTVVPDATGVADTPTPPQPPAVITNPNWISRPTGDQLMAAYPDRALENGVGGLANLQCTVQTNGSLSACSVISETPSGQGFGRAAVSLSRHFRISPRTVDGRPVEGARVSIPLRFTRPAD